MKTDEITEKEINEIVLKEYSLDWIKDYLKEKFTLYIKDEQQWNLLKY